MQKIGSKRDESFKTLVFGALFAGAVVVAMFPPIYIWAGKQHWSFLGLPFSVAYMLGICVYVTAVCFALYRVEAARGELD